MCDANGKVLKDLPKPNQSDDKTLATDAVNLFKQLKKRCSCYRQPANYPSGTGYVPAQTLDGRAVPPVSGGASAGTSLNPTAVMGGGFITMKTLLSPVFAWQKTALTAMRRMSYSRCQQETSVYRMCWKSPLNPPLHSGKFTLITNCFPLSNSSNVVVTTLLITNVMSMNCHAGTDVSARAGRIVGLERRGWQRLEESGSVYAMRKSTPYGALELETEPFFINLWRNGV